jgi:uncharacterized membrane protein YecN with MAPEG domain
LVGVATLDGFCLCVCLEEQQKADENLDRWLRVTSNDIENNILGLIALFANLFVLWFSNALPGGAWIVHVVFAALFVTGRVGHSLTYAFALSYARSAFYFLALISIYVFMIQAIVVAASNL